MAFKRIKRYQGAVFMNTGTAETPTWSRVGPAVGSFTLGLNAATEDIQDIDMETAETVLNSFTPSASLTPSVAFGDPVNDDLRQVCDQMKIGEQREFMFVDLFDTTKPGSFPARKANFNLIPQQATGGDAGGQLGFAIDVAMADVALTLGTAAVADGVWSFTAAGEDAGGE